MMLTFELRIILIFLCSFFSALFVLPKLIHIGQRIGLLDQPNLRKVHTRPRPLVGGIGIVISTIFASLIFIPIAGLRGYFLGLATLLLVGIFDDFKEICHWQKFIAQILATGFLIYFSKVSLVNFGDLIGTGDLLIPGGVVGTWLVTIFCVVGVTNAVNLIDGLDGLAGGLSFIAFLFFAIHSSLIGNNTLMLLNLALAGAVLGFLRFNWYPSLLFMGDAGSLCLGFTLAFMAIALTQGGSGVMSPVAALLVLAVPITDTIIVMVKRILRRKSPFMPDKYHLHHIFLRYGMTRGTAVKVILALGLLLGCLSLLAPLCGLSDMNLFLLFMLYFVVYLASSFYIIGLFRYSLKLRKNRAHLATSNMFLRYVFGSFDVFKIFRKSKRYNVHLGVNCILGDGTKKMNGQVINISQTGCMARINELAETPSEIPLRINVLLENKYFELVILAEHLWQSDHEGDLYHGFRFKHMTSDQYVVLDEYLKSLASKSQKEYQEATA
jgi:UDP-GlcNAc:undecaprenyl-phosphate GlcNAc-1-phosphate transferase